MEGYTPPFKITNIMLNNIASISEKVGKISVYTELDNKPHLRRNNRIKSVHSSLKIESNSLSEGMVKAVLDGKSVVGPKKEIQEVENAFKAYAEIDKVSPFSLTDLIRLHGIMTESLIEESGHFRYGAEGVFSGDRCIFVAPPASHVPELMNDLFNWLARSWQDIHPLIISSIFHYEFVFIHPFSDGNGRLARLWQTVLLTHWNPLFKFIPIESQIEKFQNAYYDAIARCNALGESTIFIEFMLSCIDDILMVVLEENQKDRG